MRIALTGASGFIGSYTARRFAEAGHAVRALVRETSRRDHIADVIETFIVGDQYDADACERLIEDADVVIHNSVAWNFRAADCGRRNTDASLRLLEQSAPRRFVFVSSVAVHHDMSDRWNGQIDEEHPLRPANDYGAYKAAVEAFLWGEHFGSGRETVAIRPCGVYGADPNLRRSIGHALIGAVRSGEPMTRENAGRMVHGKFVHVEDVAASLVAAIESDAAPGQAYNLVDCYARWSDWAAIACEELGVEREIDFSDPPQPKNRFVMDKARRDLGVSLDRGHDGIRSHLRDLIRLMESD
ncbi:MAG: NAD(P)-dependent oxidoreductase [Phycisphaerales bacterium]